MKDREARRAAANGVTKVGHDKVTKKQQRTEGTWSARGYQLPHRVKWQPLNFVIKFHAGLVQTPEYRDVT